MKKHAKKIVVLLLAVAMLIPTIAMIYSSAATSFTVELAFDNLFVFDHWVTNGNSMIIDNDFGSTNAGSISDIDLENGSFKFTNNTNHNIYTRAAAGSGEKTSENFDYYRMPVEEGASYTFSCNFTGTSPAFYPFVFFYTESNEYTGILINGNFSGEGDHSFNFTVPAGAKYIQLRLTIAGNEAKNAYAVIKDIAISRYKFELDSTNLFSLDSWVGSEKSDQPASWANYDDGRVTPKDSNSDGSYDQLYFETNVDSAETSGMLFTNFDYTSNSGYFSMDVKPNTDYTLSYNISAGNALDFQPYIVRYNSSGAFIDYINYVTTAYGVSNFTFTTTSATEYIAVVFTISHGNQSWNLTVQDIGVYETYITDYRVDPVRDTYTYNSASPSTYGTLPTPPAETYPENHIFAGWYTEPDGKGTRIASDTEILPQSMTVYPKFEPAVDTLTVKTPPTKTTYTVGEKINTTGLLLEATIDDGTGADGSITTLTINSGYYITPEYAQDTAGSQTITVHYGGKTATFTITVSAGDDKNIVVNGNTHAVTVANNNYTINYQATEPFNRYEMTYFSDSYVKGEIVMDGVAEEFFLEPSANGNFASYIDSFLRGVNHYNVDSIKFECLDKEFGNFELLSVTTIAATVPSNPTQYYENAETGYKVGIDLSFGGVVSEIYDLNHTGLESRVYTIDGKNVTKVDYAERLDADYGPNYVSRSTESINLINKFDRGRYLQQSYYGTSQKPYELGNYNGEEWPYNPVQGGNLVVNDESGNAIKGNEASKVIDYRITNEQIYIKTRPLDWGKNSVDYPDSYVTDSYMEAWYVFEDDMIKTYCRFVDFSGYPSHTRDQELPAVYIIEPLNHFVYNDIADGSEWTTTNYTKIEEPDFWGVLPSYNALLIADGQTAVDPTVDCYENWAAFTASDNSSSFGVGVYSAGVTDFHYGCFFPKYNETEAKNGNLVLTENRHAVTTTPAEENPTSYISPVGDMTFESYTPIEYSYYLTTGNADEIYEDFKRVANKDAQAELDKAKIAVPETVYMTPSDGASTVGQYYVNNLLDDNNNIITEAERNAGMSLSLYVKDGNTFSVKVTNVTEPSNDIFLCNTSGSEISETTRLSFDATDTFANSTSYGLRFSGDGLNPGEKATAKWEITVYLDDGTTETHTAYTVMYAPGRTVGAVAEMRQNSDSNNEISSWITGANGVDHQQRAPLGSLKSDYRNSGYFRVDPLVNPDTLPTGGSTNTAYDYISGYGTANGSSDDYHENAYVMQTATNDHDSSRSQSYLGLLTVDKSRYSNTNQIPNLEIGYDVLRVGSAEKNSVGKYSTYYTLGTEGSFTATTDYSAAPSGWTQFSGEYTDFAGDHDIPYRETVIPAYDVSTIDGKYIHAINHAKGDSIWAEPQYSMAGTSVLCSVTDKSALRDAVTEGYGFSEEDYTEDSYNKFLEELEDAATVLGDPSASQDEINNATDELNKAIEELTEVYYSLKYDNLFSAYEFSQKPDSMTMSISGTTIGYEDGVITTVNDTITDGETYSKYGTSDGYYLIDLKPNTEYVFEYDVTTTVNSQAFLFFYNSSGTESEPATNISVQTDRSGTWSSKTEGRGWIGNYQNGAGSKHYAIKFTTGATTTQVGFRFGNTSNNPTTSSFSNIRLIDSARYYEDVTYSITEAVYKEHASYGTLQTLTRTGYTFGGWVDAEGNTVTGADIATENKSIFSVWTEISYTIVYNKNGGSGTIANQTVKYTQSVTLASSGFTKSGNELLGWSTDSAATSVQYQLGETVSNLTDVNGRTITLYAVWGKSSVNVTFDNLFDLNAFNISTSNLKITEETETGFTVESINGSDANTGFGFEIPVEAGKTYILSADIEFKPNATGNTFDVYMQALNSSRGNEDSYILDSDCGANQEAANNIKCYMHKAGTTSADNFYIKFTAGETTKYVKIRFDANSTGSVLKVENIRFCEDMGIEVSPVNKNVTIGNTFGTLPVPAREGYTFAGWYDGDTLITAESTVTQTSTVYLKSKWVIADSALVSDTVVIDFATPAVFVPFINDTIFNAENGTKAIVGFSKDGVNYTNTLSGNYGTFSFDGTNVTYTPSAVVNGIEDIYYHASLTVDGVATIIKNKITVAPASNILYEESLFTAVPVGSNAAWNTVSVDEATANKAQSNDNVYGYDSNTEGYNRALNYSNGSAYKVTVDSEHKSSQIMKFEFTGTGFDLNGVCGPETGVFVVSIKNNATGKFLPAYVVDTYYSDSKFITETSENLYQVPIIHETGLDYGTYTIQVASSYLPTYSGAIKNLNNVSTQAVDGMEDMAVNTASVSDVEILRNVFAEMGMEDVLEAGEIKLVWFDENSVLNGGMGINTPAEDMLQTAGIEIPLDNYIDSVRVYNPIQNGNDYYIASEQNAVYYNVIGNLLSKNVLTGEKIFAYISGNSYVEGTDTYDITLESYEKHGPKDELYLTSGTSAVAFKIKDYVEGSVRVMISLRAAYGTPTVKIGGYQFNVLSNTEMYYDITDYIGEDGTVTIQNQTANTLLSIGSLKITSESVEPASISSDVDLEVARMMMFAVARDVEPNTPVVPDEPEVPDDTTTPDEPADDNNGTTEEPADDNSDECWLVRLIKHVIEMLIYVFNIIKDFLGF